MGNTYGYARVSTRDIPYENKNEILYMQRLREGVLEFHAWFYRLTASKKWLYAVLKRPKALCQPVSRSLGAPARTEARYMGSLFYGQNFGADNQCPVVEPLSP